MAGEFLMQWWTTLVLKTDDTLSPLPPKRAASYDEALKRAGDFEGNAITSPQYRVAVLLDVLGAGTDDPIELQRLIDTVPVLHAVYELGRQAGMNGE